MEPASRPFGDPAASPWRRPTLPWLRVADLVTVLQVASDAACVLVAYALAYRIWPGLSSLALLSPIREAIPYDNYRVNAIVTLCVMLPVFRSIGLYEEHHSILNIREYRDILRGWFLTMLLTILAVTTIEQSFQSRGIFLTVWVILLFLVFFFRFAVYRAGIRLRASGWRDHRALIYGAGESGRSLLRVLRRSPKSGLEIAGFLDDDPTLVGRTLDGCEVLGGGAQMGRILRETMAREVIVALPRASRSTLLRIVETCRRGGIPFRIVPSLYDIVLLQVETTEIGGIPLVGVHAPSISAWRAFVKRGVDLVLGSVAIVVLLLPAVLLWALIRIVDGGPGLFRQTRIGQDGRPFTMVKFRTMKPDSPEYAPTPASPDDPRVTAFGKFLRRTSLDEIPQLWNVLRGEMSLVGPRPEMPFLVEKYDALQRQRLVAKPGITGLWQVSPDRAEAIHDHIDYDIYYLRNQSLLLDLAILAKTVVSVIQGHGAY